MMSDFEILREMLTDNMFVPLTMTDYGKKRVVLTEKNQITYSLEICNLPEDTLIVKVDEFEINDLKDVFRKCGDNDKQGKGVCARADFAIITATSEQKFIIFLEMKSGNTSLEWEIIAQLRGAQCFIEYCKSIGKIFWEQPNFLGGYKYCFVSIRNVGVPKKQTRLKKDVLKHHDKPENMLKISNPHHIQFTHLISTAIDK